MKKTDRAKGIIFLGIMLAAVLVTLVYRARFDEEIRKLPEGLLVHLAEPLLPGDDAAADAEEWKVQVLEAGEKDAWLLVQKQRGQIRLHRFADISPEVLGREAEGEILELSVHRDWMLQIGNLVLLAVIFPLVLFWLRKAASGLAAFHDRRYAEGIRGILLFLFFLAALYGVTGLIRVPRQLLPQEQIFDFAHYVTQIQTFRDMRMEGWKEQEIYQQFSLLYQRMFGCYGVWTAGVWTASAVWAGFAAAGKRRTYEKKEKSSRGSAAGGGTDSSSDRM